MEITKQYRNNEKLRSSFNRLAEQTFGLNFENWYQNGFWGDNYDPYSIVVDGEVVANVSVNRTELMIRGERKRLYQLGTVMTAPEYRNRGYIRAIMEEVEKDTADADGVYLFANDSVREFYPKFGFEMGREMVWTREVSQGGESAMAQIRMDKAEHWKLLEKAMEKSSFRDGCHMVGNPGLIFFYVSQFMQDCVYYCEKLDAWVIAEREAGDLMIHNVFGGEDLSLEQVIAAFGDEVKQVSLGFTPLDQEHFCAREIQEEDSTFFVRGAFFREFEEARLRIPSLSHA